MTQAAVSSEQTLEVQLRSAESFASEGDIDFAHTQLSRATELLAGISPDQQRVHHGKIESIAHKAAKNAISVGLTEAGKAAARGNRRAVDIRLAMVNKGRSS